MDGETDLEMYERVWGEARREREEYERAMWAAYREITRRMSEAIEADLQRLHSEGVGEIREERMDKRKLIGGAALACYIGTIFAANWFVTHYGIVPVGF